MPSFQFRVIERRDTAISESESRVTITLSPVLDGSGAVLVPTVMGGHVTLPPMTQEDAAPFVANALVDLSLALTPSP